MAHVTEDKIMMSLWNCNNAFWTHPGQLKILISDILILVETQKPNRGLTQVEGFYGNQYLEKPHVD